MHGNAAKITAVEDRQPQRVSVLLWATQHLSALFREIRTCLDPLTEVADSSQQQPAVTTQKLACLTEQEAQEHARLFIQQGYVAIVERDVYDYSWAVEVLAPHPVKLVPRPLPSSESLLSIAEPPLSGSRNTREGGASLRQPRHAVALNASTSAT